MINLNVSFGIFAFLPQGWVFMISVILIECIILAQLIEKKWLVRKISNAVIISNIISGLVGILISMLLNGGWWLVVWFPWVSDYEVNIHNPEGLKWLVVYYLLALILSVLIEVIVNSLILKRVYPIRKVTFMTIVANLISYLIGSIVLYSYSFN